jgi:uncharacterized protein
MGLLQDWQAVAFNENADRGQLQNFWSRYFMRNFFPTRMRL